MEKCSYSFAYERYASEAELPADRREVLEAARRAAEGAYAPYSRFRVGAAARIETAESKELILTASNQESDVFPAGLCAERALLFRIFTEYPTCRIRLMAVWSPDSERPVTPCGECRQTMTEAEKRTKHSFPLLLGSRAGETLLIPEGNRLLPLAFEL